MSCRLIFCGSYLFSSAMISSCRSPCEVHFKSSCFGRCLILHNWWNFRLWCWLIHSCFVFRICWCCSCHSPLSRVYSLLCYTCSVALVIALSFSSLLLASERMCGPYLKIRKELCKLPNIAAPIFAPVIHHALIFVAASDHPLRPLSAYACVTLD